MGQKGGAGLTVARGAKGQAGPLGSRVEPGIVPRARPAKNARETPFFPALTQIFIIFAVRGSFFGSFLLFIPEFP